MRRLGAFAAPARNAVVTFSFMITSAWSAAIGSLDSCVVESVLGRWAKATANRQMDPCCSMSAREDEAEQNGQERSKRRNHVFTTPCEKDFGPTRPASIQ